MRLTSFTLLVSVLAAGASAEGPGPQPGTKGGASAPPLPTARMVYYTGNVQGVGFRATTAALARGYSVTGWVKNLSDGRVQLLVEGPVDEVSAFLKAVRSRWHENITKEQQEKEEVSGKYKTFEVAP